MRFGWIALLLLLAPLATARAQSVGPTPAQIQQLMQAGPKAAQLKPGTMDGDLVGTWQGKRTVAAVGMGDGDYTIRIFEKGQYIAIFRGPNVFTVETGRILASDGALRWQPAAGGDELMAYALEGDRTDFVASFGSPFSLSRIAGEDPTFAAAESLMRDPPIPAVSDWVRRGQEWASFWQPDAQLFNARVDAPDKDGFLTPKAQFTMTFYSTKANATLVLLPAQLGSVLTSVTPGRAFQDDLAGAIPLPLLDLSDVVKAAVAAGRRSEYVNADIGAYASEGQKGLRLIWDMLPVEDADGQRDCYDVAAAGFIDCRTMFGDPVADYNALAARAAAAWAALLHRGHGGPVPIWSLSGETMPESGGGGDQRDYEAEWRQSTAESNAYWAGDYQAYDNLQEYGCSGGSEYGC